MFGNEEIPKSTISKFWSNFFLVIAIYALTSKVR